MAVDINKFKPTYGYDASGKRQDLFLDNGKAYTSDGQRVGADWTVQTGGGTFKQNQTGTGGYSVQSHNRPTMDSYLDSFRDVVSQQQQQNQFSSDKDYGQLGIDRYTPIYEAQRKALEQQRDSGVRDLESNIAGVNTEYDRNLDLQDSMTTQALGNVEANLASRGMGRSSMAISGKANVEHQGNLAKERIATDRANTINSIHGKIESLKSGIGGQLSSLDSTRPVMEQQYGEQLEDRDFNMFMQQAGLNQGTNNMMLQAQLSMLENQFGMDMSEWQYQDEMNKQLRGAGFGGGGIEGQLTDLIRKQQLGYRDEDHLYEQQKLLNRFTPGNIENDVKKLMDEDNLTRQEAMLKLEQKYSGYGGGGYGGGGSSYTPWGGGTGSSFTPYSSGSGGGSNTGALYDATYQITSGVGNPKSYTGKQESIGTLNEFKNYLDSDPTLSKEDKTRPNQMINRKIDELQGGNFPFKPKNLKDVKLKDVTNKKKLPFGLF